MGELCGSSDNGNFGPGRSFFSNVVASYARTKSILVEEPVSSLHGGSQLSKIFRGGGQGPRMTGVNGLPIPPPGDIGNQIFHQGQLLMGKEIGVLFQCLDYHLPQSLYLVWCPVKDLNLRVSPGPKAHGIML